MAGPAGLEVRSPLVEAEAVVMARQRSSGVDEDGDCRPYIEVGSDEMRGREEKQHLEGDRTTLEETLMVQELLGCYTHHPENTRTPSTDPEHLHYCVSRQESRMLV